MLEIPVEDIEVREVPELETGGTRVIATVRYARCVRVYGETIEDVGSGAVELARAQAVALLQSEPHRIPPGGAILIDDLVLPQPPERQDE